MKSDFYYAGHHQIVAAKVKKLLQAEGEFLTPETIESTRAVGDALATLVTKNLKTALGDWCKEYSSDFARRAMADIAFADKQGLYSLIDVKTHRKDTDFNMPNLTSVERLARLYKSDTDIFSIIMVTYYIDEKAQLSVTDVKFAPIEFLDWECLTIGALGWGQIQIKNSNNLKINERYSRKEWMLTFCEIMENFYPKEITKISERLKYFEAVKRDWRKKQDIWA